MKPSPPSRRKTVVDETLQPPSALLLALESRAFLEAAACAAAWPMLRAAPRGDGHPVLVLPGLAAGDGSTWPLRRFLARCGYAAYPWRLGRNLGPKDGLVRGLFDRVRAIHREHGRKLSLVGWSLGGAMARALAVRMPSAVRSVITLGSPLGGHPRGTNAWRLFEIVSGFSANDRRLRTLAARHPRVPHTAILSKTDGIVNWRMSMAPDDAEQAENIDVPASHFGLGVNPAVLWAIADRLAQPEGEWRPFDRSGWRGLVYGKPTLRRADFGEASDLYSPGKGI
jgi:pimeloyl-ACP methyl ester carboxylesterase